MSPINKNDVHLFLTVFLVAFVASIFVGAAYHYYPPNQYIPTIEVDGKVCEVGFKQDGINSRGKPYGHDVAICPK